METKNLKLSPFNRTAKVNLIDNIIASASTSYDANKDKVLINFSVGIGKSCTKVEVSTDEINDVSRSLRLFDTEREYSISEHIDRTIEKVVPTRIVMVDGEPEKNDKGEETGREEPDPENPPFVQFKISNAKNTRYVVVPCDEWDAFVALIDGLDETADQTAANARAAYAALMEEETKRAALKAKKDAERAAADPTRK